MPKAKQDTQEEVNDQRRSRRIAGLPPDLKTNNSMRSCPSDSDTGTNVSETEVPRKRQRMGAQVSLVSLQNDPDCKPSKLSKHQKNTPSSTTGRSRSQKGPITSTPKLRRSHVETPKKSSLTSLRTTNLQSQNQSVDQSEETSGNLSISTIETPSTSFSPSSGSAKKRRSERVTQGPYHSTPYKCAHHTRSSKKRNLQPRFCDTSVVDETVNKHCELTIIPDPSEIEQQASQLAGTPCGTPVSTEPTQRRSQRRSSIGSRSNRSNIGSRSNRSSIGLPLSIVSPSTSYSSFAVPVKGQAFCECFGRKVDSRRGEFVCSCGEEDTEFDWHWDPKTCSPACELSCDGRLAKFHSNYSCGTAACRGNRPMTDQQYFWEIKMTTSVYGTDMMIGIGTAEMNLTAHTHNFCSLLGRDADSWGLSYTGNLYHSGQSRVYGSKFGQGSIIGVHLDMWKGHLHFYKNRKPLGTACKGLYGKALYPMISSTAARSAMKLTKAITIETTLQFFCCQVLRSHIPKHLGVVDVLQLPPGLRVFLENNFGWLLSSVDTTQMADESSSFSCC